MNWSLLVFIQFPLSGIFRKRSEMGPTEGRHWSFPWGGTQRMRPRPGRPVTGVRPALRRRGRDPCCRSRALLQGWGLTRVSQRAQRAVIKGIAKKSRFKLRRCDAAQGADRTGQFHGEGAARSQEGTDGEAGGGVHPELRFRRPCLTHCTGASSPPACH